MKWLRTPRILRWCSYACTLVPAMEVCSNEQTCQTPELLSQGGKESYILWWFKDRYSGCVGASTGQKRLSTAIQLMRPFIVALFGVPSLGVPGTIPRTVDGVEESPWTGALGTQTLSLSCDHVVPVSFSSPCSFQCGSPLLPLPRIDPIYIYIYISCIQMNLYTPIYIYIHI